MILRRLLDFLYEKLRARLGLVLLALALIVNIGALFSVDREATALNQARDAAVHSRLVAAKILLVQSMLYEAESAQRGFLYTDDKAYLLPLRENEGEVATQLKKLRDFVGDKGTQQQRIDSLTVLALEKIAELNLPVLTHQSGHKSAARNQMMADVEKGTMARFDAAVEKFLREEEGVLTERRERWDDIQLGIRWRFVIIVFINALLILTGSVAIMRGLAREQVRDTSDLVHEAEREAAERVKHDEREAVAAAEALQSAAELRALTAHLLHVHEDERRTVARDLHDELGGTLSAIKLDVMMGRDAAVKAGDLKAAARFQRAIAAVDSAVKFVRHLIEDLRPTLLDNLGFEVALRAMTEQFSARAGCDCIISLPEGDLNLTSVQSTTLYRVCQEALTNVMKYAEAKRVTILLTSDGVQWRLLLSDDGVGLDAAKQHGAISHGLLGMRERIVALGGTFDIHGAGGRGTTLTATFPVVESVITNL